MQLTGIEFQLASSGYQRGVDGKSSFEGGRIRGECSTGTTRRKRRSFENPRLLPPQRPPFSFFGARPARSRAQLADDLRAYGRKEGITVLILDCGPF